MLNSFKIKILLYMKYNVDNTEFLYLKLEPKM